MCGRLGERRSRSANRAQGRTHRAGWSSCGARAVEHAGGDCGRKAARWLRAAPLRRGLASGRPIARRGQGQGTFVDHRAGSTGTRRDVRLPGAHRATRATLEDLDWTSTMIVQELEAELALQVRSAVGEGPVWDEHTQSLVWVDIMNNTLHVFDP